MFALPLTKFIVKKIGGNQEAVDEVFSRTIAAAWIGWKTFKHKSSYFTWICRIALNKIADYYREQIHKESIFIAPLLEDIGELNCNHLTPDEKFALTELRVSVRSCIQLLPEEKKRLLYLRYWESLSIKKIAKILGCSDRSVEGKLYRAKKRLDEIISLHHPEIVPEYFKKLT
ncbi:hypothetical protein A2159_00815 [Candidatus Woesebacteria bacterium RBG_13_34_9]|uniref:RNA polymerase sigma factor 70 region 4 type 2 domain-containing protein n=1 Tax=Candidatus Woesebacteria bacterium RBG_13_34_9 TaxID=1802477 RepID=A0A1F7X425_9BACT|nr:MAG: hypothetical protein A2159_00815 [Candidatus Woesebacteria bacterium RBG_13_34_9]